MSDHLTTPSPSGITLVVTSCDRHDLLKVNLDSFLSHADQRPQETIIVEGSVAPMPKWLADNLNHDQARLGTLTWLQKESHLGRIHSIDRAYYQLHFSL